MFRALLYALASIFAITFIRMVLGVLLKGVGELVKSELNTGQPGRPGPVPTSGELKPCAKCGTYVLTSTERKMARGSDMLYFCSEECQRAVAGATAARA